METQGKSSDAFAKSLLYPREAELRDSRTLQIFQSEIGDVGCVVWDAAIVLAKFYEHLIHGFSQSHSHSQSLASPSFQHNQNSESISPKVTACEHKSLAEKNSVAPGNNICTSCLKDKVLSTHFSKKRIFELGSGTGYVGLIVGALGGDVTITDVPEFVELMNYNLNKNESLIKEAGGTVTVHALDWKEKTASKADLILFADCIYYEAALTPLVKTLHNMSHKETVILCCHEERTTDNKPMLQKRFFKEMSNYFSIVEFPTSMQDPTYSCDEIHIHGFQLLPPTNQ